MIDKKYFRQLIRSNRYLLSFILAVEFFFVATNVMAKEKAIVTGGVMFISLILVYALPMVIFSYVHDRKAIDVYGSLPLDRKELLNTGLLFCVMAVIVPFSLSMLANFLFTDVSLYLFVKEWIFLSIGFVTLIVFNTGLYLLGNSVFDGVVMTGAYTLMPIIGYFAITALLNTFIYGYHIDSLKVLYYISPIAAVMGIYVGNEHTWFFGNVELESEALYVLALVVFLIVSLYLLKKTFAKRRFERAGNPSSGFFAYPFVTHCYMIICLFIATSMVYDGQITLSFNVIKDYLLIYIMIFVAYVIAHFVRNRRFYISWRPVAFYLLCIVLTLSFGYAAMKTRGFGLTYHYDLKSDDYRYSYNDYSYENNEVLAFLKNNDIETTYAGVTIVADSSSSASLDKETVALFESIREQSIEAHYEGAVPGRDANMQVYDGFKAGDPYSYRYDRRYNYYSCRSISIAEMKWLSGRPNVYIGIDTEDGIYTLKDGELSFDGYEYRY